MVKSALKKEFVELFEQVGNIITCKKGTVLCHNGDIPEFVYYILSGTVVSFVESYNADEHYFSVIEAGSFVFYSAAFKAHPMNHSFKVLHEARLIKIEKSKFLSILRNNNELCMNFIYMLTDDYLASLRRHRERSTYTVSWRVCNLLLHKYMSDSKVYMGHRVIETKYSQQEIANFIQANRVSVARVIKDLKDLKLIYTIDGYYAISDLNKFKHHMDLIS